MTTTSISRTPRSARRRARDHRRALNLKERRLLRHFAEFGDLLDVVTPGGVNPPPVRGAWLEDGVVRPVTFIDPPSHWLLVPMTTKMLDQLAAVGADLEDLEEDDPGEDDRTAEGFTWPERHEDQTSLTAPNGDDEEPSLGATIAMDQRDAWRVTDTTGSEYVDGEEDDEREPEPDGIPPRVRDFIQTMRARGDRPAVQVGTDGLNSSAFGRWLKL